MIEELRAAKPQLPQDVENWAEGESAKRILAQILATEVVPERPASRRRSLATTRLAWGAIVAVLVGLAVFLGVHFLAGGGSNQVVSQPTVTTSVAPGGEAVTTEQALEQIIELEQATIRHGQQGPGLGHEPSFVDEAIAFRLVRPSESSSIQLGQPTTRRRFALWLWRGFGAFLPEGSAIANVSDLGMLTPEEQQAVEDLVRVGVVQLAEDRVFGGDQVLTSDEEVALLARVKSLVSGPSPS